MRKFWTTPPERVRTASAKPSARSDAADWPATTSTPSRALSVVDSIAAPLTCRIARRIASPTASEAVAPKPSAMTLTLSSLPTSSAGIVGADGGGAAIVVASPLVTAGDGPATGAGAAGLAGGGGGAAGF